MKPAHCGWASHNAKPSSKDEITASGGGIKTPPARFPPHIKVYAPPLETEVVDPLLEGHAKVGSEVLTDTVSDPVSVALNEGNVNEGSVSEGSPNEGAVN